MDKVLKVLEDETFFKSKTQSDKSFDYVYKEYPKAHKNAVPSMFALITAIEYFKNKIINVTKYTENLEKAINVSAMLDLKDVNMVDLINFTNIEPSSIVQISADQITRKEKSWNLIIPDIIIPSCIIMLKNTNFFIIISDPVSALYHVQDCQQSQQNSFNDKDMLIKYLNKQYSLSDEMVVDGVKFPEYSKIQYLSIQKPFIDMIDYRLEQALFAPKVQRVIGAIGAIGAAGATVAPGATDTTKDRLIIKPIDSGDKKSIVIGYVDNPPDDHVDMMELQRKFGEGEYVPGEYVPGEYVQGEYVQGGNAMAPNPAKKFADANFDSDEDDNRYEEDDDDYFDD